MRPSPLTLWSMALLGALAACSKFSPPREAFPSWAYVPVALTVPDGGWNAKTLLSVPDSPVQLTEAAVHDLNTVPDWRPEGHPAAPEVVMWGRTGAVVACGYCHLADGSGRPENSALAGLPANYLRDQVAAFRSGARKGARPEWLPTRLMVELSARVTEAELAAAVDYYSKLPPRSHVKVVEAAQVPGPEERAGVLMAVEGAPLVPLGQRIVEGPDSFERFERRDSEVTYTAYVPVGSLALGRALVESGNSGRTAPCLTCHGPGLKGGPGVIGPALAGRSPTSLFRQLHAFSTGARSGPPLAAAMQTVARQLSQADMIAACGFAASLPP